MAAAQNVRSGSNPGSTYDPDLRSRPFEKIWSRPLEWCIGKLMFGPMMLAYFGVFLLCSYSPCQAAKQQTVAKLRCQAVKLSSCACRKTTLLSGQAVQQPSCNCCTSTLSNCKADIVTSCKASLRSSQACRHFFVMLHPSCNIYKHVGPLLGRSRPIQTRSRPQPAPIQTTTSSGLKLVIVWFLSFL